MTEDEGKKEEDKLEFDSAGQAIAYISLEQAQVLALRHAHDTRGAYGRRYQRSELVWDVHGGNETEDYYNVRLSWQPLKNFGGEPGIEQFIIDKTGFIEIRQILMEPRPARRSLFGGLGRPSISGVERDEVLDYFNKTTAILLFQTRETDRYNSTLLIHGSHLKDPDSVAELVAASKRLAMSAEECVSRLGSLSPIPERAIASYAAWNLALQGYSEWAGAQHDRLVAIEQGRAPYAVRIRQLMIEFARLRKRAEGKDKHLLKKLGLKAGVAQRIIGAPRV